MTVHFMKSFDDIIEIFCAHARTHHFSDKETALIQTLRNGTNASLIVGLPLIEWRFEGVSMTSERDLLSENRELVERFAEVCIDKRTLPSAQFCLWQLGSYCLYEYVTRYADYVLIKKKWVYIIYMRCVRARRCHPNAWHIP